MPGIVHKISNDVATMTDECLQSPRQKNDKKHKDKNKND